MVDEKSRRLTDFQTGVDVLLSDGQHWTLPEPERSPNDPDLIAICEAITEAEDRDDRLRLELALLIFLIKKNYELSADEIGYLLEFPPGDAPLVQLQGDLRKLSTRILEKLNQ